MADLSQILPPQAVTALGLANGDVEQGSKIASMIKSAQPANDTAKQIMLIRNHLQTADDFGRAFAELQSSGTDFEKMLGQGKLSGLVAEHVTGPLNLNPSVNSFENERQKMAISLGRLAAGTGRPPQPEMVKQFYTNLPDATANWQKFGDGVYTSIVDAFKNKASLEGHELSDDPKSMQEAQDYAHQLIGKYMPQSEYKDFLKRSLNQSKATLPAVSINPTLNLGTSGAQETAQ